MPDLDNDSSDYLSASILRETAEGESFGAWSNLAAWASAEPEGWRVTRLQLDSRGKPSPALERLTQFRLGSDQAFIDLSYHRIGNPPTATHQQGLATEGSRGLGMNVAFRQRAWPTFTLSVVRAIPENGSDSFDVLNRVRFDRADSLSNSASGQVSYTWRFLTLNLKATKVQTLENTWRIQDKNVLAYDAGVSFNLFGGRLVFAPSLSRSETDALPTADPATELRGSSPVTRTTMATLAATGILIPDELTISGQMSLARARSNDEEGGQRIATTDVTGRLTWHIEKYLGNRGRQALLFQANWNRVADAVSPGNNRREISVLLTLDVSGAFLF